MPGRTGRPCPLLGLAPGGVYRADDVAVAAGALLPHRFTLTCGRFPGPSAVSLCCTSVRSPRPGSRQHPARWSPDFPRRANSSRPPGHLTIAAAKCTGPSRQSDSNAGVRDLGVDAERHDGEVVHHDSDDGRFDRARDGHASVVDRQRRSRRSARTVRGLFQSVQKGATGSKPVHRCIRQQFVRHDRESGWGRST